MYVWKRQGCKHRDELWVLYTCICAGCCCVVALYLCVLRLFGNDGVIRFWEAIVFLIYQYRFEMSGAVIEFLECQILEIAKDDLLRP